MARRELTPIGSITQCYVDSLPTDLLLRIFQLGVADNSLQVDFQYKLIPPSPSEELSQSDGRSDTSDDADGGDIPEGSDDDNSANEDDDGGDVDGEGDEEGGEGERGDEDDAYDEDEDDDEAHYRRRRVIPPRAFGSGDVRFLSFFQNIVSQVCRRWRNAAISTPSLWTAIVVSTRTPHENVVRQLERGEDLPIDVVCPFGSRDLYTLLLKHVHRWRTLRMDFFTRKSMNVFLRAASHLSVSPAAQLSKLELNVQLSPINRRLSQPVFGPLFSGSAPLLERITLWEVHVDWDQPWISSASNLTYLELRCEPHQAFPTWEQFFTILRGAPKLKKLILRYLGPYDPPPHFSSHTPTQLLDLTDLIIGDTFSDYTLRWLHRLYMPSLKNLGVGFSIRDNLRFLARLASMSMTPPSPTAQPRRLLSGIERFRLFDFPPCLEEDIRSFYGALQNVRSLALPIHDHRAFVKILGMPCELPGQRVWLPRLESLYITEPSNGWPLVHRVLEERQKMGHPVKSMYLDPSFPFDPEGFEECKALVAKFNFYNYDDTVIL